VWPHSSFQANYTQRIINFVHSFKINTNFSVDELGKYYCLTFSWIQCIYTIKIFKSGVHVRNVFCPLYYWLLKFVCVVYYILGNCQLFCATFSFSTFHWGHVFGIAWGVCFAMVGLSAPDVLRDWRCNKGSCFGLHIFKYFLAFFVVQKYY
jgi:hypothetical protein